MRRLLAIAALVVVLLPADHAAGAAGDRSLTTRKHAVSSLPSRFRNISTVACAPDKSSATALRGGVRVWQRFWCAGRTYQRVSFRLRFETTGTCDACWRIARLSGTGAADLRTRRPPSPAPSTTPSPAPSGPTPDYPGLGAGHWVSDISADASVVRLEDGSLWLVSPSSRAAVAGWLPMAPVTVRTGTDGSYGYRLVNTDNQRTADARFLRYD